MARDIKEKDVKLLWGLSAGRCAFPGCRQLTVLEGSTKDPAAVIGEMAHIVAYSDAPTAPRSDPSLDPSARDSYQNLILLCPTHHAQVDKQANTHTAEDLRRWKREIESWVEDMLKKEIPEVTFAELEIVTKALLQSGTSPEDSFVITPPREKMDRNHLHHTRRLVTLGMANARLVEGFVTRFASLVPDFPEGLKAGFRARYSACFESGLRGDALFEALFDFASSGSKDFALQAAGLSVLVYLFEKCEVFDP